MLNVIAIRACYIYHIILIGLTGHCKIGRVVDYLNNYLHKFQCMIQWKIYLLFMNPFLSTPRPKEPVCMVLVVDMFVAF